MLMARHGTWRIAFALVAIAAIAGFAVSSGNGASDQRKRGGTLKLISAGDVDSVDPGQTYYAFGFQMLTPVHRTLYQIPADSVKTVPDLAAGPPRISSDGKTVTIRIKRGVRFSPPVNREVTAADVKYGIERSFASSVPNGYVYTYFADIVGSPAKPPKTPKPIRGIQTPDEYTLVLKLKAPSTSLVGALVMPITAPVPKEYAAPFDSKTTSIVPPGRERPVHVRGGQLREHQEQGLHTGKADAPRPQPELVDEDRLPARVRRRDRGEGGIRRRQRGGAADPERDRRRSR
jgi:ABC-type transport system substrate-binding protein